MADFIAALGREVLTRVVSKYKFGTGNFQKIFPRTPIGGNVETFDIVDPSRVVGSFTNGAALDVAPDSVSKQAATVFRQSYKHDFIGNDLLQLRLLGQNAEDRLGVGIRERYMTQLKRRIDLTNELLCALAMTGTISVKHNGVTRTVDFGIPAGHKPTVTKSWSDPDATIIADFKAWKKMIQKDSGYAAVKVRCPSDVFAYILNNSKVVTAIGGSAMAAKAVEGGVIENFLGATWIEDDSGYKTDEGVWIPYIAENHIIITPDETEPGWAHGSEGVEVIRNPESGQLETVDGLFSNAVYMDDPTTIRIIVGDNFIPVLDIPNAVVYGLVIKP